VMVHVSMGLAAFWFTDVTPLYWIWQKSLFVLGGLMLPLEFYPSWLVRLGSLTPFPSVLAGPGAFVLGRATTSYALPLAARLLFWMLAAALCAQQLFGRATRRLQLNGG
jgi:ABC-2 type transport system permease protein